MQNAESAILIRLVRFLVDAFNEKVLGEVAKSNQNMLYVDVRQSVGSHEWFDEIHPNDRGFNSVAVRVYEAIAAARPVGAHPSASD